METICIFGGSGSFGTRMTDFVLKNTDDKLIIFDRAEKPQWEHKLKFKSDRINYVIGDIRDYDSVKKVLSGVDHVFLAAALKHIDKCEANPEECYKTNILGCLNVINASIECNVKKLIFLSTDKAVNPTTIYGTSKLFIEQYMQAVDNRNTTLIRTRYGNVFGSNGSVAWVFDNCVKNNTPLTVTNPDMTRFFMKLDDAVKLVWTAKEQGQNGDLWVYNNKSCTIKELADEFSSNQIISGLRCIEKNDEALLSLSELSHSIRIGDYFRINKQIEKNDKYSQSLTSDNAERLTKEEIQDFIADWRRWNNI